MNYKLLREENRYNRYLNGIRKGILDDIEITDSCDNIFLIHYKINQLVNKVKKFLSKNHYSIVNETKKVDIEEYIFLEYNFLVYKGNEPLNIKVKCGRYGKTLFITSNRLLNNLLFDFIQSNYVIGEEDKPKKRKKKDKISE